MFNAMSLERERY